MSFKATLTIEGKSFDILECTSLLRQKHNAKGNPASGVTAGILHIILEGTADDTFAKWITDPTARKDGTIVYFRTDQDSKFKEIKFKSAYLIRLTESTIIPEDVRPDHLAVGDAITPAQREKFNEIMTFHARTSMSYIMYCYISAEKITIDGVDHDNQW